MDGKIKEKLEMGEMMISAGTDWMNLIRICIASIERFM